MKKLLAIIIALLMMLALFACKDSEVNDQKDNETRVNTEAIDKTQPETEPQVAGVTAEHYETDAEFQIGKVIGNTYENKFLGIKCVVDDTWTFLSEKEVASLNKVMQDYTPEYITDIYKESNTFIDMMVAAENGRDNINVSVAKINGEADNYDIENELDRAALMIKEPLENMGYKDIEVDIGTMSLDGDTYYSMSLTGTDGYEDSAYQQMVVMLRNDYCVTLTASSYIENKCTEYLGYFTIYTEEEYSSMEDVTDNDSLHYQNDEGFQIGQVTANTYENKFFGIKCIMDDSWVFYTDKEIAELNNLTMSLLEDDLVKAYENSDVFIDMYVRSKSSYNNINVSGYKMSDSDILDFDVEKNIENAIDIVEENFENMGYTNCNFEVNKININGKNYDTYYCTADGNNMKMYQQQLSMLRNGYLVSITVTTYDNDRCEELLSNWIIY